MIAFLKKHTFLVLVGLLVIATGLLFREAIIWGKVPVALDYGVSTFQPWKLDFEGTFTKAPKPIGHDDIRIFYPQRKFITESVKNGALPFWNPYEFAGNVSIANSQTATFYPPFALFLIFPRLLAWTLLSASIPILAGIGCFLFLRKVLNDGFAAVFGGLVFAFSSAVITRTQDGLVAGHTVIWLPWALYGIEVWLKEGKWRGIGVVGSALVLSMLAGWFQFTFYVYTVAVLYALFRWRGEKKSQPLMVLFGTILGSLLLTAFHWLPALEALRYSPRGALGAPAEFTSKHLMPIAHLLTLLIPEFFGHIGNSTYYGASEFKEGVITIGTIPFLVSLVALFRKSKEDLPKFFSLLFAASLLLGLKNPMSKLVIFLNIPLVSTFLPNRVLILGSFALAILASFGFKEISQGKREKLAKVAKVALGAFMLLYVATATLYIYEKVLAQIVGFSLFEKGIERYVRISIKESLIPAVLVVILFALLRGLKKKTSALLVFLFAATIIGQVISGSRYLYFSDQKHEFPTNPVFTFLEEKTGKDYSRFLSLSYSRIPSNIPLYYNLYFPEGVDAMYPMWYGEFTGFYNSGASAQYFSRIEASFSEEFERRGWVDPKNINLLSHLGIRYIAVPKDHHTLPPEPVFKKVFSYKWHTIYEYKYAFPKAYFVPRFSVTEKKILGLLRIFHPEFFDQPEVLLSTNQELGFPIGSSQGKVLVSNLDLREKSLRKNDIVSPDPFANVKHALEEFSKNPVEVVSYTSNRVELSAKLMEAGFIIVNDAYFPGWEATVDGVNQPVLRANHAFRAIAVDKGEQRIVFSYYPKSFRIGTRIAAVAATLLLLCIPLVPMVIRWKKRK
ncbi:MAG: hypothetical protein A2900_03095 [Candidatus Chisholmbacteria bacterium RIFCSPLOWO2_01_FULL_50_28]|uniref:Membrane protein 6-pyruvoyl-tetrahydropterin synthase-related domain-containing protein n=1 Tax=Candidatus Chisholmbacteria bacterium RIFCSPHIGHO2_01_FULL_52_32 TaxID=1797591 RepID=A0A1G1VTN3_9BACT|nr:MAG: hypothetical protein A2786_03650 [Candidatus Chisholmbacteria bacterium RIFCSPHIGHO2_01_FULL_52_32]OGY20062.1 MAG: hypothetical protein A2900_03095 [Candidatus Chisholmbacteria bacterium RIFCSPLOWO2_01_FULL_50_28]